MFVTLDFRRYLLAGCLAVGITAVLILIMHYAIHTDEPNYDPRDTVVLHDWAPEIVEQPPTKRIPKPPKVEPPVAPPPTVTPTVDSIGDPAPFEIVVPGPTPTGGEGTFGNPDGEFTPLMTIPPEYPSRALAQGIEGWVIVEFTVDSIGRVSSPRVLDAHPGSVFNKAALKAVQRYKYKPRVVDGQPQAVPGVRQKIVFSTPA